MKISVFDYDAATNTAIIGYKSGNLDVVTADGVTYVVDIPLSQSYTGSKTINNISINGDKAVISVGYGVSIFNITKKNLGILVSFLMVLLKKSFRSHHKRQYGLCDYRK